MMTLTRAELLGQGLDDLAIRRMVKAGILRRPHRGRYCWAAGMNDDASPEQQHLVRARAAIESSRPDEVALGYLSAAIAHGLPVSRASLDRVTLIDVLGKGRRGQRVWVSGTALADDDLVIKDGLLTTSVPRTLVDLGRRTTLGWTVAAMDNALRRRLCTFEELGEVVQGCRGTRGVVGVRHALSLADARSESPGESLSRVMFVQAGLAPDDLQREFGHERGADRVDFWWDEGVIGEFDGKGKYLRDADQGVAINEVVWAEKMREDRLRRQGHVVVRWTWGDLWTRHSLVTRWVHEARIRHRR